MNGTIGLRVGYEGAGRMKFLDTSSYLMKTCTYNLDFDGEKLRKYFFSSRYCLELFYKNKNCKRLLTVKNFCSYT
ncbi:unnamed protein product [Brugia timori]|uniref:Uncharacterized protein n=1 Tax=Brugia timori TaxID=42155 RepID=A0A0R3QQ74_9BILA|nr:unnamed protein product [Brugia timori]